MGVGAGVAVGVEEAESLEAAAETVALFLGAPPGATREFASGEGNLIAAVVDEG